MRYESFVSLNRLCLTIYNHQFDITDRILRQMSHTTAEPDSKDYLYGVVYPLEEE